MSGHRVRRVESLLLREIARLLRREVKDPRARELTITRVEVRPDLSFARVFYLGAPPPAATQTAVASFLRGRLGKLLRMRQIPELRLIHDKGLAGALEMNPLWQEVRQRRSDLPEGFDAFGDTYGVEEAGAHGELEEEPGSSSDASEPDEGELSDG